MGITTAVYTANIWAIKTKLMAQANNMANPMGSFKLGSCGIDFGKTESIVCICVVDGVARSIAGGERQTHVVNDLPLPDFGKVGYYFHWGYNPLSNSRQCLRSIFHQL